MNRLFFLLTPVMLAVVVTVSGSLVTLRPAHAVEQTYKGTPVGITSDGVPYRGQLDAKVILVEYSDYLCPFCARYFSTTMPALVDEYVKTGKLRMEFRDFPIPALHPTAAVGAYAAGCAAEQGAVQFWSMHDALFERQREWSKLPEPSNFLKSVAEDVGLDMVSYAACMESEVQVRRVEQAIGVGKELGFNGTPSFQFLDGNDPQKAHTVVGARPKEYFAKFADALLAGESPPEEPKPKKRELPDWAKPDGLAPDPARPGYTLAGDPFRGDPKSRLVVVEFTDFQCPACKKHALETQPTLDSELIDTGKVRWVTKHLPLRMHANAPAAAAAAVCAGDQSEFWKMHHALFEAQAQWSDLDEPDAALTAIAVGLGLDERSFAACLQSRRALERVLTDIYDANGIARTTPTFVLLDGENGQSMRGAREADKFIAVIENLLEKPRDEQE